MAKPATGLTKLLEDYRTGDAQAQEKLFGVVYSELKIIARHHMRRQNPKHTLSPTALVHEAFLVLGARKDLEISNRKHFFAIAATCMRWILRDHARAKKSQKRGSAPVQVSFDEKIHGAEWTMDELIVLNDVLTKLGEKDERLSKVVELRFLMGLNIEETAEVMETSAATVKRDWDIARAWLRKELSKVSG